MDREFEGNIWFLPSEAFTDLSDPESRERFKALMKLQYGFSDEFLDRSIEQLRWQEYWREEAPNLLVTVRSEENPRFRQVGGLLGYLSDGKYLVSFGDTIIERFGEDEILLLEKANIMPQIGIKVEFLDENWEKVIQEGGLISYEEAGPDRKKGDPPGWYFIKVGEEIKKVEDWLMLGGTNVRFKLK